MAAGKRASLLSRIATGPARLWDEDGNLCAIATQTANLRLFPNE
jgi:hypothetical protein